MDTYKNKTAQKTASVMNENRHKETPAGETLPEKSFTNMKKTDLHKLKSAISDYQSTTMYPHLEKILTRPRSRSLLAAKDCQLIMDHSDIKQQYLSVHFSQSGNDSFNEARAVAIRKSLIDEFVQEKFMIYDQELEFLVKYGMAHDFTANEATLNKYLDIAKKMAQIRNAGDWEKDDHLGYEAVHAYEHEHESQKTLKKEITPDQARAEAVRLLTINRSDLMAPVSRTKNTAADITWHQEKNYCWSYCISAMLKNYGVYVSPAAVRETAILYGNIRDKKTIDSIQNDMQVFSEMSYVFSRFLPNIASISRQYSKNDADSCLKDIIDELNTNRKPIAYRAGGHYKIIKSYDSTKKIFLIQNSSADRTDGSAIPDGMPHDDYMKYDDMKNNLEASADEIELNWLEDIEVNEKNQVTDNKFKEKYEAGQLIAKEASKDSFDLDGSEHGSIVNHVRVSNVLYPKDVVDEFKKGEKTLDEIIDGKAMQNRNLRSMQLLNNPVASDRAIVYLEKHAEKLLKLTDSMKESLDMSNACQGYLKTCFEQISRCAVPVLKLNRNKDSDPVESYSLYKAVEEAYMAMSSIIQQERAVPDIINSTNLMRLAKLLMNGHSRS